MNTEIIKGLIRLARPHQYLKNLFVLLPLFFGWKLTDQAALSGALMAFAVFCLAASSVYVFNDLRDDHGDVGSASLLEVWIDETERRTWFLFEATRGADATGH